MVLMSLSCLVFAQGMGSKRMTTSLADYLGQKSEMLGIRGLEKESLQGTKYLYQDWRKGVILIKNYDKPLAHGKIKMDVWNGFVEFDMGASGIKVLNFSEIDTLYLDNRLGKTQTFVRASPVRNMYRVESIREIVFEGPFQLAKEYELVYKKGNYNTAMAAGKNYDEAVITTTMVVIEGDRSYEISKKNKEILGFLSKYYSNTDALYKKHKPKLKDEEELLSFITVHLEPTKN